MALQIKHQGITCIELLAFCSEWRFWRFEIHGMMYKNRGQFNSMCTQVTKGTDYSNRSSMR